MTASVVVGMLHMPVPAQMSGIRKMALYVILMTHYIVLPFACGRRLIHVRCVCANDST